MKFVSILLVLFASLIFAPSVNAHKIKTAFTIVLFNDRTDNLEVVHRFYLHDAEEAVWELFDKKADIIANEKTQQQFAEYVIGNFTMLDQNNTPIKLETIGYQNEGGYFWVYQEIKQPTDLTELKIRHNALKDIWTEQFNVVNIEGLDQIYTLNFSDQDEWIAINVKRKP